MTQLDVWIGELGWPTDGHPNATLRLSQQFNQGAVTRLMNGLGTPKRPNRVIPFYIFALLDEDGKSIRPGAFERRWGIYSDHGLPKYNLDLSGAGNPAAQLPAVPGLSLLPQRWCVVSDKLREALPSPDSVVQLQTVVSDMCGADPLQSSDNADLGDCTPLTSVLSTPGYQCAAASAKSSFPIAFNASYALNAAFQVLRMRPTCMCAQSSRILHLLLHLYSLHLPTACYCLGLPLISLCFQAKGQDYSTCIHDGVGVVTYTDPSLDGCTFSVGLDIDAIEAYYNPGSQWSWAILGYIVALIAVLTTFL